MAKALSSLALGSLICIYENSQIALYEIAGFNVHGANTATLVRKNIYVPQVMFDTSESQPYGGSNLDSVMQAFESKYSIQHRNALLSASIVYATGTSVSQTIARKVFALSYTELSGSTNLSVAENAHLSLYSSNASRTKAVSGGGTVQGWWTRSLNTAVSTWKRFVHQNTLAGQFGANSPTDNEGVVPAFVLPSSTQVSDSAIPEGGYLPTFYNDLTPGKPVLISPVDIYVEIDKDITFNWLHVIDTGSTQTKADLQYSLNGGAWTTLKTVAGSAQSVVVSAGTFTAGNLRWRARTYNADNVASSWSDPVAFVGVGAPAAPTISGVSAASRPKVSWQSVGQVGYQVQFLDSGKVIHDSGETGGVDKAYVLPFYLVNGAYSVRVRIVNTLIMWSNWSTLNFMVAVTPPDAPSLSAELVGCGVHITVDDAGDNTVHLYLMRNDLPIAEVTGLAEYIDCAALGVTKYTLRAVDANEKYADSHPAWVTVSVPTVSIAAIDDLENGCVMYQKPTGQPAVSCQKQIIGTSRHYAGRKRPLYTFSEFENETYTPSYYYTSLSEWRKLEELIDRHQTVLYRDTHGNRYYGVITAVNHTQEAGMIIFALTIERVDYVEEISYAEVTA